MAIFQKRSKRKASGGRYGKIIKRIKQMGNLPSLTKVGETRIKEKRVMGGHQKDSLLSANKVNVIDPKTKKAKVAVIKSVIESPANRHFVRRNVVTRGAVVDTDLGKVKITSRPGQERIVNGVLVK
jgi:small subunit ribosomal protein S8e